MADAPILGAAKSKKVSLDETAFGAPFNGPLVHESVRAELNARRRGTHATKTRGNVRGGGAKPWRQKGTGRARAGSSRSPIWVGGGTIFGPSPRKYTFKVNRKERRAALRSALSVHADRNSVAIFDPAQFATPSTQAAGRCWPPPGSARRRSSCSSTRRSTPRCRFATSARLGAAGVDGRGRRSDRRRRRRLLAGGVEALTARAKGEVATERERNEAEVAEA